MAAKPKLTPEQWAGTRAAWEADPRKPLAWLIPELDLPVSAEALRLRAKSEGWVKGRVASGDYSSGCARKPADHEPEKPCTTRQNAKHAAATQAEDSDDVPYGGISLVTR